MTNKVLITDGVFGTQLQMSAARRGCFAELLNTDNPAAVEAVAKSYIQAGSDIIMSNTLGANRVTLKAHGYCEKAYELAFAGASISKKAAEGTGVKVFGSFGPTGKLIMMGQVSERELFEAFSETAEALVKAGVDGIVLETFTDMAETEIALKAVKSNCNLPVVVSMTFAYGADYCATMMGNTPEQLAAIAKDCGADIIGANCGLGPDCYVKITERLKKASDMPVWIKPNAGMPILSEDGRTVFPMGPAEFAGYAEKLVEAGADFIGGCCGTTPGHIKALRKMVDKKEIL